LESATKVKNAHIRSIHLRLPGHENEGPTLEIFHYNQQKSRPQDAPNRPGFFHIAFAVEDVQVTLNSVINAGGSAIGELVSASIGGAGQIIFVYAADPEGNIIELQQRSNE